LNKPDFNRTAFPVNNFDIIKDKMLNWANQFSIFCFLDNHSYQIEPHSEECLLAADVRREINCNEGNALQQLQQFINEKPSWLFGHLGYDIKNEIENLNSSHPDGIEFPDLYFFEPEVIVRLNATEMIIEAENASEIFAAINNTETYQPASHSKFEIKNRIEKEEYCNIINKLKQHILRGDCYEINFCQEFYAEHAEINPVAVYTKLSALSPNPFSALYKLNDKWLLCASPERYIKRQGNNILSQPIKGTSKRNLQSVTDDKKQRDDLYNSPKDRSENVMVVDLVRNDLAKVCKDGSVHVDELYGIYSFPQVHQMISTVSGELKENISFSEIIKASFPMGSMSGAPKKRVMELIERYEKTKRGIFSGAVGYINPDSDFDFNVVIRSIIYNAATNYLSFSAGSGITFYSDAEKEWEECMMKADAMRGALK
jgi:para-aminobenzoate synthetase component I